MPTSSFLDWGQLFRQVLDIQAATAFLYLPPDHPCKISYPTRLRAHGHGSQLYQHIVTSENPGPFYIIDAVIWDCLGRFIVHSATFVVPSRIPVSDVNDYRAEWLIDLSVYMVHRVSSPAASSKSVWATPTGLKVQPTDYQLGNRSNTDKLFDIEYFPENLETFGRDESQYDLGLFAVRHVDKKPETRESTFSSSASLEESELLKLLKPENFSWSDCDDIFESDRSSQLRKEQPEVVLKERSHPPQDASNQLVTITNDSSRKHKPKTIQAKKSSRKSRLPTPILSEVEEMPALPPIVEEEEEEEEELDVPDEQRQSSSDRRPLEDTQNENDLSLHPDNDMQVMESLREAARSENLSQRW